MARDRGRLRRLRRLSGRHRPRHTGGDRPGGAWLRGELAERTGCDPVRLERVLRFAAGRGFVKLDRKGRVAPTGVTAALRTDAPAPWRGWVRFAAAEWFDAAWRRLGPSLSASSAVSFEMAHGAPFFEYTTTVMPSAGEAFDQAMAAGATIQAMALACTLDWTETTSVCDVGGGNDATLDTLQRHQPALRATLFDLPAVVDRTDSVRSGRGLHREITAGSFFDEVPAGHDRYLLLAIIHDWTDDQAVTILSRGG